MSLIRLATRIILVNALMGRTDAGDNVHDSLIGIVEIGEKDGEEVPPKPFIAVYTDASQAENIDAGNVHAIGNLEIIFEWGVTAVMEEIDPVTGASIGNVVDFPMTDSGMEASLDLIGAQIVRVLADPTNKWSELFRSYVGHKGSIIRARTSSDDGGERRAAHQMRLSCEMMDEPTLHDEGEQVLDGFFALVREEGTPGQKDLVDLMEAQLAADQNEYLAVRERLGLTRETAFSLGVGFLNTNPPDANV